MAAIARRQGGARFRTALIENYQGRCAVTGCEVEEALEAAHIIPYRGEETNHPQNGLLLRSDLHTLFDRYLVAIDPESGRVLVHPRLRDGTYGELHGRPARLPASAEARPSAEALKRHRAECGF